MRLEVMDHTGHSVYDFKSDEAGLKAAEEKFREITGLGFRAAVPTGDGEHKIVRDFDKDADEMLFVPHLVGG